MHSSRPPSRFARFCGIRTCLVLAFVPLLGLTAAPSPAPRAASERFLQSELIFPAEHWHNHGSCIVETPRGGLLVCWFHGSGERKSDDVKIEGARRRRGADSWSERFTLADTPGYPDTNCSFFQDSEGQLWLVWPTILANLWESSLLKFRRTTDFEREGPPRWQSDGVIHVTPGPEFDAAVQQWVPTAERAVNAPDSKIPAGSREEVLRYLSAMREKSSDKLYRRLGWMTRAHPYVLGKRIILPLYHDGFSCSLMAVSDDGGTTWQTSTPLMGGGNIQPVLARRRDGTLVAHMRDNGPAPARVHESESRDGGLTWLPVHDNEIPNPGSGTDLTVLKDGRWLFIGNDTEEGRHQLVVMLSDDEGRTWPHRRYLEKDPPGPRAGRFHYPSIIQARDGSLHATYSHHLSTDQPLPKDADGKPAHSSIKHAHFNVAWILAGP